MDGAMVLCSGCLKEFEVNQDTISPMCPFCKEDNSVLVMLVLITMLNS